MVKENITQVVAGIGAGKVFQILMRKYGDLGLAQYMLYTPAQYVKDLVKAGYLRAAPADTDDDIAKAVATEAGYPFGGYVVAGSGGNLLGTNKLTANMFTYRAAAGQKVAPWMMPSAWLSGLVGGVVTVEGAYNFTGADFTRKNDVGVAAMGVSLLADGITRGIGVDGTIAAPSGFDITKEPIMQYLDPSALDSIKKLAADNQRLQVEVAALRAAQPPRGAPPGVAAYEVRTSDIIPKRGAEHVTARTGMMGHGGATLETLRRTTGLVTLSPGGR